MNLKQNIYHLKSQHNKNEKPFLNIQMNSELKTLIDRKQQTMNSHKFKVGCKLKKNNKWKQLPIFL
jgi:hypothetical protein